MKGEKRKMAKSNIPTISKGIDKVSKANKLLSK